MKERWLYCEGPSDAPVLKAVFGALSFDVIAEWTGGNPAQIARWQRVHGMVAASISDRDYRSEADCNASYQNDSVKFLWNRHSIESYLLTPEVVTLAIQRIKRSLQAMPHPPAYTESLPENDIEVIKNNLAQAARQIMHKECGCICVHSLWADLNESLGRIQQRIPAVFTSGDKATEEQCVTALKDEADRLMKVATDASGAHHLNDRMIGERFTSQLNHMEQPSYWDNLKFLHEFHGKRFVRAFLSQMDESYGLRLPKELFLQELTTAIENIAITTPDADCLADFRKLGNAVLNLND